MRELTNGEIMDISGGVKLGRFLVDALVGGLVGALSGALAGPGGALTGFCVGAVGAMTADLTNGAYDAHEAASAARITEQQRQVELQQQNSDLIRFVSL
jgi:uncharacterized membrane protein YeaQ/YmgE (transglycosylase-associated protein family)